MDKAVKRCSGCGKKFTPESEFNHFCQTCIKVFKINHESSYLPVDIASLLREHAEGEQIGQTSRISDLDDVFKWMPGTINAFYGWANDGKGTFYDFLAVMKAKFDKWKFCMMKQEDISSTKYKNEAPKITANRIFKGLVWTYTGKCPYKAFSEKNRIQQISRDEYMDALEWAEQHFFIVNPKDRRFRNVMDLYMFMYEKYGINAFLTDPLKSVIIANEPGKRADYVLDDVFIECKDFAVKTNTVFDIIAHPKTLTDVKEGKGQDAPFKVVTQFLAAGGAPLDNNMDGQYSIYRPERHLNPRDPNVEFHNLKQRNNEEVGAQRGVYRGIKFDRLTRRYFFKGVCPMDGSMEKSAPLHTAPIDFSEPKTQYQPSVKDDDDLPF